MVKQQIVFIHRNLCLLLRKYLPLSSEDKPTSCPPFGKETFLPPGISSNRYLKNGYKKKIGKNLFPDKH